MTKRHEKELVKFHFIKKKIDSLIGYKRCSRFIKNQIYRLSNKEQLVKTRRFSLWESMHFDRELFKLARKSRCQ